MVKSIFVVILLSSALFAQVGGAAANPGAQASPSTQSTDDLMRMRQDLDRMDSLLLNMSAEIEFLRDQNLQILLRTNSQMWTLLLRDMRSQLAREEQRQALPAASEAPRSAPPTKPR